MKKIKVYIRNYGIYLGILLLYVVLLSILNYTGALKLTTISKINFVFIALISLILGTINGKKASKKGYLEGLKLGGIIVLILLVMNIIFYRSFSLTTFLYYILIIISSTIGSMIGINLKR